MSMITLGSQAPLLHITALQVGIPQGFSWPVLFPLNSKYHPLSFLQLMTMCWWRTNLPSTARKLYRRKLWWGRGRERVCFSLRQKFKNLLNSCHLLVTFHWDVTPLFPSHSFPEAKTSKWRLGSGQLLVHSISLLSLEFLCTYWH